MIEKFGKIYTNQNQKNYTTYKLSGKIKTVIYPKTIEDLKQLIKYLKENQKKYKIIGNGSNIIFKGDYDGTIIKLDEFNKLTIQDDIVTVEAGYNLIKLAIKTANNSLSGLEFASGIPGTIGGAVYMNAGAYNKSISDILIEIKALDENQNIITLSNKDLKFSYRNSLLKTKNLICLSAKLKLTKTNKEEILKLIKKRKQKRIKTQPLNFPSAGSTFRNPKDNYAGKLIEDLNLKETKIGDAMISEKHANFIINTGNATGKEIEKLINIVKQKVKEKYNIELILEQEIIE